MTGDERHDDIYPAALSLVVLVYRALDAADGAVLAGCFTPDCAWHRPDGTLRGHEAIIRMAESRDTTRTTAHIVGNLAVEPSGEDWIARYYLTVYVGQDQMGSLASILCCEDRLTATPNGLRVTEKSSSRLLAFPR